jgi:hypothetical protein
MSATVSEKTRTYLMVLIRTADLDPDLAHRCRVRIQAGVTHAEATRLIAALKEAAQ